MLLIDLLIVLLTNGSNKMIDDCLLYVPTKHADMNATVWLCLSLGKYVPYREENMSTAM